MGHGWDVWEYRVFWLIQDIQKIWVMKILYFKQKEEIVGKYFYCFFGIFSRVSNIHKLTRGIIRIEEEENLHTSMTARAGREW